MLNVLDLFCGAGGASEGIHQAAPTAQITGVDNQPQPDYLFDFILSDWQNICLDGFDFIWASPPCQAYSRGGNSKSRAKYPLLIPQVRQALLDSGKPFVIENVVGAPLRKDLLLCGEMFGLKVIRHRVFEVHGFKCRQPALVCKRHKGKVVNGVCVMVCRGGRCGCFGDKQKRALLKAPTLEQANAAMGITHIKTFAGVAESIPPAYSKYIFTEYLRGESVND